MIYLILIAFVLGTALCLIGFSDTLQERFGRFASMAIKLLGYATGVVGLCLIAALFLLDTFAFGLECSDTIIAQIPSPDGAYIAYAFSRDCGAVTSSGEMLPAVLLRDRDHPVQFDGEAIIFRKDWRGREKDVVYHGELSEIDWLSNDHLQLNIETGTHGESTWNGIRISYQSKKKKNFPKARSKSTTHSLVRR